MKRHQEVSVSSSSESAQQHSHDTTRRARHRSKFQSPLHRRVLSNAIRIRLIIERRWFQSPLHRRVLSNAYCRLSKARKSTGFSLLFIGECSATSDLSNSTGVKTLVSVSSSSESAQQLCAARFSGNV